MNRKDTTHMSRQRGESSVNSFWALNLDRTESWAYCAGAFTADECAQIIEIGESRILHPGVISSGDKSLRKSDVVFLHPDEKTKWVFERVTGVISTLNQQFFKFDLSGLGEGLQFTRYKAPDGNYSKHVDAGPDFPVRKLSFTLQLSNPDTYEGGDMRLHLAEEPTTIERKQGYVAVFPSWTLHEVKPVTKGTRYSLVAWVTGPSFK